MSGRTSPAGGDGNLGVWIGFGLVFSLFIGMAAAAIGWMARQGLLALITGGGAFIVFFTAWIAVIALIVRRS